MSIDFSTETLARLVAVLGVSWLLTGAATAVTPPNLAATQLVGLEKCLSQAVDAADGTQLTLAACGKAGQNQSWSLPLRGTTGPIRSKDGRCIDVRGAVTTDFTPIIIFPCHGRANQEWSHTLDGRLVGLGGKCLDIQSASNEDGTPLILFRCHGQANQRWRADSTNRWDASHLLAGGKVLHLVSAPADPRILYAAAGSSGLFRSEDDGVTWAPMSRGVEAGAVDFVAVDPEDANRLLIIAGRQIHLSRDRGKTFDVVYRERPVRGVFWAPQGERIYALAEGADFLASDDGGQTWIFLANIADSRLEFSDLAFGPGESPTLWAASPTCAFFCGGSLWRSDDGGANWFRELEGEPSRLVVDPRRQKLFVLEGETLRQRSWTSGVAPWQEVHRFSSYILDLWVDPLADWALASTVDGLFRTQDFVTWTEVEAGLALGSQDEKAERIRRFAVGSTGILAGVDAPALPESLRVIRTTDQGLSWQPSSAEGWTAGSFHDVEIQGDKVYSAGDTGIFRSVDGGSSWSLLKDPEPGLVYTGLTIDPQAPTRFFASGSRTELGPVVWRSEDAGAHWTVSVSHTNPNGSFETRGLVSTVLAGQTIVVTAVDGRFAGEQVQGVLRSPNLGATWEAVQLGGKVAQLATGAAPGELFAGGAAGVHRSVDGGDSWTQEIDDPVWALASTGQEAYAVGEGKFWRRQAGAWQETPFGGDFGRPTLLRATQTPGWLYLATEDQGIFRSLDFGASWQALNQGLPSRRVFALEPLSTDTRRLWAALEGHGLFRGLFEANAPQTVDHGRFVIQVAWKDFAGATGRGVPASLTRDTAHFWFFDPANIELAVKVLDGRAINGYFWVFFASLTNVEFDLEVFDLWTGQSRTYHNPPGTLASVGDTFALPAFASAGVVPQAASFEPRGFSSGDGTDLSVVDAPINEFVELGGRFEVRVRWSAQGQSSSGLGKKITEDTGYFYFFSPDNVELLIKVLDGRAINGHFWVFFGGLSNVAYDIEVRDRQTGQVKIYQNPAGQFASSADLEAF